MSYTKTRIWHGGAFEGDDVHAQGSDEPGVVDASERSTADGVAGERAGEAAAVGAEPEPTRFYPIEELFPGHARERGAEGDPEPTGASRARSRRLFERLRYGWLSSLTTPAVPTRGERLWRWGLVLAPLAVLGLMAALTLARTRERLASEETRAAPASHPTAGEGEGDPRGAASNAAAAEPRDPAEEQAPPELTPGLERAAVDALIRGDLDEAERHYRELVRQHPAQPAFREALRILSNRTQAR